MIVAWAANLPAASYLAGDWPIEVTVKPDQPRIVLGEPAWLTFEVANRSDEPLQILVGGDYQNQLGRPGSFVVRAVAGNGKWAAVPDAGENSGGLVAAHDVPARGSYVFRLFVPHWATLTEPGVYTLVCRRTLKLLRPTSGVSFAKIPTSDVAVDVRTTLEVLPRDPARLKSVIHELGTRMIDANGEREGDEAMIALSWIEDPGVVPYFRRMLEIRSYALRFIAVQRLGKFGTDDALAGLKTALAFTGADFDSPTPEKAAENAARIRAAAVGALLRCPHPNARDVLLAQRRDPAERVRLAVVNALAQMPRAQALPLLDELSKDGSAEVSAEARRVATAMRKAK